MNRGTYQHPLEDASSPSTPSLQIQASASPQVDNLIHAAMQWVNCYTVKMWCYIYTYSEGVTAKVSPSEGGGWS